jgi:hypothetical protein
MTTTQHPRTDLTAVAAAGPRVTVGRALKDWVFVPWVRGAAGLPLAIAAVPLALVGRSDTAGRWQSRLALRFDAGAAAGATPRRLGPVHVIGHSLMVALPALASALLAALVAFTFYSGYLYPLRPDASFAIGHPFTADPSSHNPGADQPWPAPSSSTPALPSVSRSACSARKSGQVLDVRFCSRPGPMVRGCCWL